MNDQLTAIPKLPKIGDKCFYQKENHYGIEWRETTVNETYLELIGENPGDYRWGVDAELLVVKWIKWTDATKKETSVEGMGGWFNFNAGGHRWADYLETIVTNKHPYVEAVRRSVLYSGIRLTGDAHQHSPAGVPLFSDNTVCMLTFRAWGDLMAAIWSEQENKDYNYMDFYM
jgi:hypothetical protein